MSNPSGSIIKPSGICELISTGVLNCELNEIKISITYSDFSVWAYFGIFDNALCDCVDYASHII
jgi:hypothetical protein